MLGAKQGRAVWGSKNRDTALPDGCVPDHFYVILIKSLEL